MALGPAFQAVVADSLVWGLQYITGEKETVRHAALAALVSLWGKDGTLKLGNLMV